MAISRERQMEELMTVDELAAYLHFSKKTIYNLVKDKTLPAIRIGDSLRFSRAAIDETLQQPQARSRHILIIDDTASVCAIMRRVFENEGHVVITATSGMEGLEQMQEIRFDHVFLDLVMPDLNGPETLKRMREIDAAVPVTLITGHPDSQLVHEATNYGVEHILVKPFNTRDMLEAIQKGNQGEKERIR